MKINKALVATGLTLVMGQAWAQQSSTTTTTSPATTTTLKVEEPSKVGANYAAEFYTPSFNKELEGNRVHYDIGHYIGAQYNFSKGLFLGGTLRPNTLIATDDSKVSYGAKLGDSYLRFGVPLLNSESTGTTIKANIRYYFPTSKGSADNWSAGNFNPRLYVTQKLGESASVTYILIPIFYRYLSGAENLPGYGAANKTVIAQPLEFSADLSESISAEVGAELDWIETNSGKVVFEDTMWAGPTFKLGTKSSLSTYLYSPVSGTSIAKTYVGGLFQYTFL